MYLYTTVTALRAEGIPDSVPDSRIFDRIRYASRAIETWTGRYFYPQQKTIQVDGRDAPVLRLGEPIIEIQSVKFLAPELEYDVPDEVLLADLEVYNRHLTQGLLDEDDREDPRIVLISTRARPWPNGSKNIEVAGVFGYTDPAPGDRLSGEGPFVLVDGTTLEIRVDGDEDTQTFVVQSADFAELGAATADELALAMARDLAGVYVQAEGTRVRIFSTTLGASSSVEIVGGTAAAAMGFSVGVGSYPRGVTPADIVRCCQLMVVRDLERIGRPGDREERLRSRFVKSLRTREQSVSFGFPTDVGERRGHAFIGYFTGDPEIDNILARYSRPADGFWV